MGKQDSGGREAGCYLRREGGAGCQVHGVAQSATAEPRRSLDSAISERAAPLRPQLALPRRLNACWLLALSLLAPQRKDKGAEGDVRVGL